MSGSKPSTLAFDVLVQRLNLRVFVLDDGAILNTSSVKPENSS